MSVNKVILIGRTTKDIELQYSQSGIAIGSFTLAVQRQFKNANNEYETDFIRCKAFKKTAETLANHVNKGHRVAIEGNIQTGSYQNKEGRTVYTTDVIVQNFTFLESRNSSGHPNKQQQAIDTANELVKNSDSVSTDDSDLPF